MIVVNRPIIANLTALAFCAIALGAAQPVPPPVDPTVKPRIDLDSPKVERAPEINEKMFPDGVVHDFGKVHFQTQPKHTFRIVNTSTVPLRIVEVRASMSPLIACPTKDLLQPNEEAKLEITLDTRRFVGPKTTALYLSTDNGRPMVTRFIITADSQKSLEPAEKIDPMFPDGLSHEFGKVQRGTQVHHAFRIVNTLNVPLRISSLRVSMGRGTRAISSKDVLQPNEEGIVEITMDTRRYVGSITQTVFVLFDQPRLKEHRLSVSTVSCDNLACFPDNLDFGKIKRGDTPTRHMIVAVPDQPKLQVNRATCDSKFIQVKVEELARGTTRAVYQVTATVRGDIPEGELRAEVELATNNPAMPKLSIPVNVVVETPR